jgi:Uma2 family endonuclease
METMSTPETIIRSNLPIRPLKRLEFEELGKKGFFDDERVELLFGMVIAMSAPEPPHSRAGYHLRRMLELQLGERAEVHDQSAFAASDISEPIPDISVVPPADYWREHPTRAFLIVEVSWSSLRKDKGPKLALYGLADVDEYWIVNLVESVVEVYRDRHDGEWRAKSTYQRGDTIAPVAFPDVTIAVTDILPPAE